MDWAFLPGLRSEPETGQHAASAGLALWLHAATKVRASLSSRASHVHLRPQGTAQAVGALCTLTTLLDVCEHGLAVSQDYSEGLCLSVGATKRGEEQGGGNRARSSPAVLGNLCYHFGRSL